MTTIPPNVPAIIAGRYSLERELGRGGTATVFLARDAAHGRQVAVKLLRPEMTASMGAERFLREIRTTAGLQHPRIVSILDSGEHAGVLYCVLPFMAGGTLRDRLASEKQLPIAEAVRVGRAMAEALDYAHRHGLVHRDVKPENILFSEGEPCLADFGIARALETSGLTTTTGIVRGTPAYMSPEQAGGERDYDGRSDIYSLGCVLYEMITGMPPFVGPTQQAVLAQRFAHKPRPMRVYRETVSDELEAVVESAMQMAPADRFATAGEMIRALDQVPVGPTTAAAALPRGRLSRGWRRVPPAALAAGAAAIVLAGALLLARPGGGGPAAVHAAVDTTRLALFPFERASGSIEERRAPPHDQLAYEAFLSWRGITVVDPFQVSDALQRLTDAQHTSPALRSAAADLGAGRYVRGRVTPVDNGYRVAASLYDVRAGDPLQSAVVHVPEDAAGSDSAYAELAAALLMRADRLPPTGRSRSLPATQAFASGLLAIDDWDLDRADSLFQASIAFDPEYARASFWLAQIRAWNRRDPGTWLALAERARSGVQPLSERENAHAAALTLLARGEYAGACGAYREMVQQTPREFAAWYGLGLCHELDTVAVRDPRTPTGWRYRSSYHQAILAYTRAFELVPSVHKNFQRGAYLRLRELLFTRAGKLREAAVLPPDTATVYGVAAWLGDTLAVLTPDAVYMDARALLALGDTATATAFLDSQLARVGQLGPGSLGFVETAGLLRATRLMADLAEASEGPTSAAALRWRAAITILWPDRSHPR